MAVLVAVASLACSSPAFGSETSAADFLGPFADLGVALRSQVFRVHSPEGPFGEFHTVGLRPALTIGSPMFTFGGGKAGVNVVWNTTAFSFGRQARPGDEVLIWSPTEDVGTSLKGYATYVTPALNLIGEPKKWFDAGRIGLGFGVGYLRAEGDILLNHPKAGTKEPVTDPELRRIDLDEWTGSFVLFAEARRGSLTYSFSIAGPVVFGGYATEYYDVSLAVSWSWYRRLREPSPAAVPAPPPGGSPAAD